MRTELGSIVFASALISMSLGSASIGKTERQDPHVDCRLVTSKDLYDPKAPRFSAYSTGKDETITHPKLDLKSAEIGRAFRTVLRQGARKGPNFGGHYRVIVWGCGSSCASFAVVNLVTGKILGVKDPGAISGVDFEVADFLPHTDSEDTSFRYKKNSRLLVLIGAMDEDPAREGAFYYVIEDDRLTLIHSTKVRKNCE